MSEPGAGSGVGLVSVILVSSFFVLRWPLLLSPGAPTCFHRQPPAWLLKAQVPCTGVCANLGIQFSHPSLPARPTGHEQAEGIGFEGKTVPLHL